MACYNQGTQEVITTIISLLIDWHLLDVKKRQSMEEDLLFLKKSKPKDTCISVAWDTQKISRSTNHQVSACQ